MPERLDLAPKRAMPDPSEMRYPPPAYPAFSGAKRYPKVPRKTPTPSTGTATGVGAGAGATPELSSPPLPHPARTANNSNAIIRSRVVASFRLHLTTLASNCRVSRKVKASFFPSSPGPAVRRPSQGTKILRDVAWIPEIPMEYVQVQQLRSTSSHQGVK